MEAETHPDPLREAMTHGLQRATQVASFAGTAAQVCIYHQKTQARAAAERDERARRALQAQIRAERDAARAGWSPALDPQWLRDAGLRDTAQAWGAAMPYADRSVPWHEPTAAAAMRKSEERLRDLHPFAMARYDRLRAEGLGPAEAMRDAAPLFALSPRARAWPFTAAPALNASTGADAARAADLPATGSKPADLPGTEALELRGRSIVTALQERALAAGREPLGHDELKAVLEAVTNLPADVIDRVTQPAARQRSRTNRTGQHCRPRARSRGRGAHRTEGQPDQPDHSAVAARLPGSPPRSCRRRSRRPAPYHRGERYLSSPGGQPGHPSRRSRPCLTSRLPPDPLGRLRRYAAGRTGPHGSGRRTPHAYPRSRTGAANPSP